MMGVEPTRDRAGAQFVRLTRDLIGFAGGRLGRVALAATVAALAEGTGLLLLVPVLGLLGVTGSPGSTGSALAPWFGPVTLETALAIYVGLVAAAATIVRGRTLATQRLRLDYIDNLRQRLHHALVAMEWQAFARLRGAEVTQVLTIDVTRAAQGVEFLLKLGGWAIQVTMLLAVAVRLSPALTVCLLASAVLAAVLAQPLNRRTHRLGRVLGKAGQALQADLADDLAGMRVIRAFGLEAARQAVFAHRMTTVRTSQLAHQQAIGTARAVTQTGAAALVAAILVTATRGFGLPLADTLVLILVLVRLLVTLTGIQDGWRMVLHALPAHAHAHALLERCRDAAEPADPTPEPAPPLTKAIRLEDVGYHHGGEGPDAISGISAEIPALGVTALVGPSGAGKSTLADLLLGLTAPSSGRILVDDRVLEGTRRRDWRRKVGYVPQDGFLFHDTIRTNLLAVAPAANDDTLWRVLDQAAAAGFVRMLPRGLDAVVGDRGSCLSGGERQRLALARALLANPSLLILDEATSALDAASEKHILDALSRLKGRLTVVVIAHRPSTVENADHVLVLDHGRLAAAGSWSEVVLNAGPLLDRLALGEGRG